MSVFTFVQRALPLPLAWKRRPSASKGKEKGIDLDDAFEIDIQSPTTASKVSFAENAPEPLTAKIPNPSLPSDVPHALQVAVKQSPSHAASADDLSDALHATNSDPVSDSQAYSFPDLPRSSSPRAQLVRAVSWASIVRSQCRWTAEQEQELLRAEKQLARCQRAWSSEQELWISHVQALSEEKEAHEGFMLMRTKQQEEERVQFRKACKRRRSIEDAEQQKQTFLVIRRNSSGLQKLRRTQHAYIASSNMGALASAKSPVLTCQG